MLEARDVTRYWPTATSCCSGVDDRRPAGPHRRADRSQRRRQVDAAARAVGRAAADARRARCSTGGRSPPTPPPSWRAGAPWCRRRACWPFPSPCSRSPCWASPCPGFRRTTAGRTRGGHRGARAAVGLSAAGGPPLRPPVGRRAPARPHRPRPVPARRVRGPCRRDAAACCSTSPPPISTSPTRASCSRPSAGRPSGDAPCSPSCTTSTSPRRLPTTGAAGARRGRGCGPCPPGPARRPAVGRLRLPRIRQPHPRRRPPVRAAAGRVLCPACPRNPARSGRTGPAAGRHHRLTGNVRPGVTPVFRRPVHMLSRSPKEHLQRCV